MGEGARREGAGRFMDRLLTARFDSIRCDVTVSCDFYPKDESP